MLASGASLSEVARQLYLSPNTVKTHRRSIYRKLGVSTRAELLAWAAGRDERPVGDVRARRRAAAYASAARSETRYATISASGKKIRLKMK